MFTSIVISIIDGEKKGCYMTVGQRICNRRQELGMTQEELAFKMGYKTRNAIYQYEKAENMKLSLIRKFAQALDCTEAYLSGWEDKSIEETLTEAYIKGQEVKELTPNTEEEKQLIRSFRELDEESQRQIVLMLAFLKEQNRK